jgi:hypothetical protein
MAKSQHNVSGRRLARIIAEEHSHSPRWFYISFSGDTDFLGATFVRAHGVQTAIQRARDLDIYPSLHVEDVLCLPILRKDLYRVPAKMRNRLLNEAEVRKLGGKRVGE